MDYAEGEQIVGKNIDFVFLGSCTNGRIEDFRAFTEIVKGKKKAPNVTAWLVPGSHKVEKAIKEEGLNIPKDISIIGFDNARLSKLVKPKLTTVQLPYSEMTQKAIQHIIDPQKFDDNFNILVESPLIKRESVKVKK